MTNPGGKRNGRVRLNPAWGHALGADARVEVRRGRLYGFVNYGLSSTTYSSRSSSFQLGYGDDDRLRYNPPHDRRHQVNALLSVSFASFEMSARWEFGSGLPYTQTRATVPPGPCRRRRPSAPPPPHLASSI